MRILLGLAFLVLAALAVRWLITARRQNVVEHHDDPEVYGSHIPFRASGQVKRALRAAEHTRVRDPQQPPEPGTGPTLRP
jgi:hypothetical protein